MAPCLEREKECGDEAVAACWDWCSCSSTQTSCTALPLEAAKIAETEIAKEFRHDLSTIFAELPWLAEAWVLLRTPEKTTP